MLISLGEFHNYNQDTERRCDAGNVTHCIKSEIKMDLQRLVKQFHRDNPTFLNSTGLM